MVLEIQQYSIKNEKVFKCRENGKDICDITALRGVYFFEFLENGHQLKMGFYINNTAQTIPRWVLSDSSYKEALTGRFSKFSTAAIVNATMWIYEGYSYVGSILASANDHGKLLLSNQSTI